jgi:hypothetical protein
MVALQLAPVGLSLLVLAAHFLRSGNLALVAIALGLIGLMGLRRRWVVHAVRIALLLGALEWIRTLALLASARQQAGVPAGRLVLILGGVAVVTAASTLCFRAARVRAWFGVEGARSRGG